MAELLVERAARHFGEPQHGAFAGPVGLAQGGVDLRGGQAGDECGQVQGGLEGQPFGEEGSLLAMAK